MPAAGDGHVVARFRLGDLEIDPASSLLIRESVHTSISPRSMGVLIHLREHVGQLVTTVDLRSQASAGPISTNAVHKCVVELRRAFGKSRRGTPTIRTIHGRGYLLVKPSVTEKNYEKPVSVSIRRFESTGDQPIDQKELTAIRRVLAEALARDSRIHVSEQSESGDGPSSSEFMVDGSILRSMQQLDVRLRLAHVVRGRGHFLARICLPRDELMESLADVAEEMISLLTDVD